MQKCLYCQKEFEPDGSVNRRKRPKSPNEGKFCSVSCGRTWNNKHRTPLQPNVQCAYCYKDFYMNTSKKKNSKSGLFFCCREHKDLAQRIEYNLREIWPDHYNDGISSFREIILRNKEARCEICNFNKVPEILQVHHVDRDRTNNSLTNLQLLCPNCHIEIHFRTKTGAFHFSKQN